MRSVASAPTRPAFTSRLSRSRICARWSGWRSGFPRQGSRHPSTASAMCSAPARNLDRNCSPARIWKARISPAGSMGRSASSTPSKPPASSIPIRTQPGAVEVAAWCDEEGHFGNFLGSRSYVGGVTEADIDAARDRSSGRTMRDALREVGPRRPAARQRRTRAAHRISRGAYRAGRNARKRRPAIGVVTSIVGIWQYRITFERRAKSRRHDPDGRSQGRRPGAGPILRRYRRSLPCTWRTAHGMDHRPHHARSRRAEHHPGTRRKCCSRFATTIPR